MPIPKLRCKNHEEPIGSCLFAYIELHQYAISIR